MLAVRPESASSAHTLENGTLSSPDANPSLLSQEAHINGLACVIACSQETAEKYCEGLRNNGLISSLEPDSGA